MAVGWQENTGPVGGIQMLPYRVHGLYPPLLISYPTHNCPGLAVQIDFTLTVLMAPDEFAIIIRCPDIPRPIPKIMVGGGANPLIDMAVLI